MQIIYFIYEIEPDNFPSIPAGKLPQGSNIPLLCSRVFDWEVVYSKISEVMEEKGK